MLKHIVRRVLSMIPVLLMISIMSFAVIQAPPGDFVDAYVDGQRAAGFPVTPETEAAYRVRYGVDEPLTQQYFSWIGGVLTGDLGISLQQQAPVKDIIADRLPFTILIGTLSFVFLNAIAIPIGVLSATRQYSFTDYALSVFGFLAMGIPDFILAIVVLWGVFQATGDVSVGLMDPGFVGQAWSVGKFMNVVGHLWLPALIAAATGTAGTIRILRANLLDELEKPYVTVARAKGLPRRKLLYKYPLRMALNPFVVGAASILPGLVSGELIVSLTLGIPTLAPVFLTSLEQQDMQLAGSIVLILSTVTVVGILISDILLAVLDPRIRDSV